MNGAPAPGGKGASGAGKLGGVLGPIGACGVPANDAFTTGDEVGNGGPDIVPIALDERDGGVPVDMMIAK